MVARAGLLWVAFAGACAQQPLRTVEAVTSCAIHSRQSVAASGSPEEGAWRVGRYRLAQVITSLPPGRTPFVYTEGALRLALPTVEEVAASKRREFGRYHRRDLRLVGTWSVREIASPDVAEVDGDTLYLGARWGFDVSPTALGTTGAADRRIWGTWRDPQTGYVMVADPVSHEPLKELAGVFCAEWVGP
jgi:hypothetical protein